MATNTSNFCLCLRCDRAEKPWNALLKRSLTVRISNRQKWQQDFILTTNKLGGWEPCKALKVHPLTHIKPKCQGLPRRQLQLGLLSEKCSQTLTEASSDTPRLLRDSGSCYFIFYLKVRAQLKKATGCEILQPVGNQINVWKCGSQQSARQKLGWSWSQGKCQEFLSWEKFLSL